MYGDPEAIAYCHACGTAMDVSAVAPFTNAECPECGRHTRVKREFGPYTLLRRHAIGGMSMVFVAQDNTLNREVALKILSEDFSADEQRIAAFEEEARITASFSHPNVVRVLTTGYSFGRFYIAMELVPGGHLEHQIRERGRIPEPEMLQLAIEVAEGLKAAHAAGLIHRDVKPGNILLDAAGHAKLVDFGLALVTHGGKAQAAEIWATPYYVPPETVEGRPEDFRSDMYAFGASLYHALSGKAPCDEDTMDTEKLREAKKRVVPLGVADPSISPDTCAVVDRAMSYDPANRFESYEEMITALVQALNHLRLGRPAGGGRDRRSGRKRFVWIAAVVMIGLVGIIAFWLATMKAPAPVVVAEPQPVPSPPPANGNAAPDPSAHIGRSYQEARGALAKKDFAGAALLFRELHHNAAVQEPTRSWAGVETVLSLYLAGNSVEARTQAKEVLEHVKSLPDQASVGAPVIGVLERLSDPRPIPAPAPSADSSEVVAAMLGGLKNWEQGLIEPANKCFHIVADAQLAPDNTLSGIYQSIARDYLEDYIRITGLLFEQLPEDKVGCDFAVEQLDEVYAALKTMGRARFNVRAWQLDLRRHAKLLSEADSRPVTGSDDPGAGNGVNDSQEGDATSDAG